MTFKRVMFEECSMFWRKVGFLSTVSQAFKFSNITPCSILCLSKKVGLLVTVSQPQNFSRMLFCFMFWRKVYILGFLAIVSQI